MGRRRDEGLPEGVYAYATAAGQRFRATWRTSDGRQQTRRGFTSPQAAARHRRERMVAADRGELVASRGVTLAAYCGDARSGWLHDHRPTVEPGTWEDYERHVRLRIAPRRDGRPAPGSLGARRLSRIDPADVRAARAAWLASGLARKTVNNCLRVLALVLDQAVADGLIARNPATAQGRERLMLQLEHAEMDFLERHEIGAYLASCSRHYRPVAETLLLTGMRVGEACALEVGDVRASEGAILVNRSRKRAGVGSTKGDRRHRVEVGARLLRTLGDHVAREAEHRAVDRTSPLFVRPALPGYRAGGPIDRYIVSRWHQEALEHAGLRHLRVHDLRHSAAALWLSLGEPLTFVQRQLGHAHYTTTDREYGHLAKGVLGEAASRAEMAIFGSSRS